MIAGKLKMIPKISIIIPVYNSEKFLERCIDSLLNQTFKDIELLLVNDCSQDKSGEICDAYAKIDTRIKIIYKAKNEGVSAARNSGIDAAKGRYIMFCDSDDYVSPVWCRILYDAISKNKRAWIVSNIWRVKNDQKVLQTKEKDLTDYFQIFKSGLSAYTVNKIYDLDMIKKKGIRFDINCFMGEDVLFNIEYYKQCDSILFIDEPLYYYCDNPEGAMGKYYVDSFSLNLPLFFKRCPLIKRNELQEYCDIWFYQFWKLFDNVFDLRNKKMSFFTKLRFNQAMMNTQEFKYCVEHSSQLATNNMYANVLKTYNYYLIYLYQKLSFVKRMLIKTRKF